jgi:hypothetical protein
MKKKRSIISQRKRRTIIITTVLALSTAGSVLASSQTPLVVVQTPSVHVHLVIASGSPDTSCQI